jgi:hypothetical protein
MADRSLYITSRHSANCLKVQRDATGGLWGVFGGL